MYTYAHTRASSCIRNNSRPGKCLAHLFTELVNVDISTVHWKKLLAQWVTNAVIYYTVCQRRDACLVTNTNIIFVVFIDRFRQHDSWWGSTGCEKCSTNIHTFVSCQQCFELQASGWLGAFGGRVWERGGGEVAAAAAAPLGVGNVAGSEGLVTMARAGWGDGIQPQVASWCGCGVSTMIGHFPSTDGWRYLQWWHWERRRRHQVVLSLSSGGDITEDVGQRQGRPHPLLRLGRWRAHRHLHQRGESTGEVTDREGVIASPHAHLTWPAAGIMAHVR